MKSESLAGPTQHNARSSLLPWPKRGRPTREAPARWRFMQKRPRTSSKSQLSTNTISLSHRTSRLTTDLSLIHPHTPLVTQRTATRWAMTQRDYAGHQRLTLARRSGRPSTTVQPPIPSSNARQRDVLERAVAMRGRPWRRRTRSSELGLLWT